MTGICGIVSSQPVSDIDGRVDAMLDAMKHEPWHVVERSAPGSDRFAGGRVSLGFVNTGRQPASLPEENLTGLMDGEVYSADALWQQCGVPAGGQNGASQAELLLRGYRKEGRDFFPSLDGKYSAALYDDARSRVVLVNDRFGMKPLYYTLTDGGEFLFASEIKALLCNPQVSRAQNPRGIAQFFAFGHLWGEETFFDSIRALPPGAWVEYDAENRRLSVGRYRTLSGVTETAGDRTALLEQIDAAFKDAVEERVTHTPHLGLSLSGGMDARTILGAIDCNSTPLEAVCMGMPGSRDQRSSREMARLAGCGYHDFVLGTDFLANFRTHLERMVELTDGHYLSQCIVLPTFPYYRKLGIEVLLRGHAGELMHMQKAYNFSLDDEALRIRSVDALNGWLYRHLRAYMLDALDEPLLAFADEGETDQIARDSIRQSLENSADWNEPLQRIWQLFLTERLRRETAMSLVKFGSVVETRLPYLDSSLVDLLLSAPVDLKLDEEIQAYILKRRKPSFLNVTNVNTGARIGAGPLVRWFQYNKMRVLAKLGVRGYQPYERLGLWLRRELNPLVRELLLDERCLDRGTFRPSAVRKVVDQHTSGARNHTFLILAMMIFETGQRRFADGENAALRQGMAPQHV